MSNPEEPIFPPDGEADRGRYESADISIDNLEKYLTDTKFESEKDIVDFFLQKYGMKRNESIGEIQTNMTREFKIDGLGKVIKSKPLSGFEPEEVLQMGLTTVDERTFDLRIFKITNRNQQFRFGYILDQLNE